MKGLVWPLLLVVSLAGAGFGAMSGRGVAKPVRSGVQLQVPQGPTNWVPFRASYTHVDDRGPTVVGTFYQGSDGSTRSETGPSLAEINIIGIKNISEGVFYLWHPSEGWESHPMDLPSSGWRPPLRRTLNGRTTMVSDQIESFSLVKTTDRRGVIMYEAPQLNFFPLRVTTPCRNPLTTGCGTWLSHISVGEQPTEYFKPPTGEQVVPRSEPGGIVRRQRH
jgi:hypothetical protein